MNHPDVAAASVELAFREDRARLIAILAARFGDLDLAEDVAADAMETALARWPWTASPAARWRGW